MAAAVARMSMPYRLLLPLLIGAGLALPGHSLFARRADRSEIARVVQEYVKTVYARDFANAYGFITQRDRAHKQRETYIEEQRPFTGFTLELARKLADSVEALPEQPLTGHERAKARFTVTVPDVERLAPELLDWDEDKLNSLSFAGQQELIAKINRWQKELRVPLTRVEETFELVRETDGWKVFLNWRSPVVVEVGIRLAHEAPLEAEVAPAQIAFRPGEPFTITVNIKNTSRREVRARVAHRVEPASLEKYLGVGDCGTFVPFRLAPGRQHQNRSTFLVWTDLPAETKQFRMVYDFEIDQP
jgi:hypothetical protein